MSRRRKPGRKHRDWTGFRLNNLTIIGRGPINKTGGDHHALWVGLCDCGRKRLVRSNELSKGVKDPEEGAHHCGKYDCPYRRGSLAAARAQRGALIKLTHLEAQAALAEPCRLCGAASEGKFSLGLYNPKLGYTQGNVFSLCPLCTGLQPVKKKLAKLHSFADLIAHICDILNYLVDTGEIKLQDPPPNS